MTFWLAKMGLRVPLHTIVKVITFKQSGCVLLHEAVNVFASGGCKEAWKLFVDTIQFNDDEPEMIFLLIQPVFAYDVYFAKFNFSGYYEG